MAVNPVANEKKTGRSQFADQVKEIRWRRLVIAFVSLVVISFALAYLVQRFVVSRNLPIYEIAWLAYLIVFLVSILTNLSVLVPVPLAVSVMLAAATKWDPVLIALAGAVGGAIGELSGYYAGYLGKKLAIPEGIAIYEMVERWVNRWGFWAILLLTLQPVIPFDIGGFVAGAARMPMRKFFTALVLGKFPKYLIIIYAGLGLIRCLPFLR